MSSKVNSKFVPGTIVEIKKNHSGAWNLDEHSSWMSAMLDARDVCMILISDPAKIYENFKVARRTNISFIENEWRLWILVLHPKLGPVMVYKCDMRVLNE